MKWFFAFASVFFALVGIYSRYTGADLGTVGFYVAVASFNMCLYLFLSKKDVDND